MELILTEEQRMIADSAAALLKDYNGAAVARARRDEEASFDRRLWREIGDAGWFSADDGGLGFVDRALLCHQAGRALLSLPLVEGLVAADAMAAGAPAGEGIVLAGLLSAGVPKDGLPGGAREVVVPDGANADRVLALSPDGDGHVTVLETAGLSPRIDRQVDGVAAARFMLDPDRMSRYASGQEETRRLHALLLLLTSAQLLGVAEKALEIALAYIRIRVQYGKPLGANQALQHRAVEEYVKVETIRACVFQSCGMADRSGRLDLAFAAATKSKASELALEVTRAAIQLHGGIGYTDEHEIGFYLKSAMVLSARYGNANESRSLYAAETGLSLLRSERR